MRLRIVLTLLCLYIATVLFSQNISVQGILVDTLQEPLMSATVVLLNPQDSTMEYFAITTISGYFKMKGVKPGEYIFQSSYVGFESRYKNLDLTMFLNGILGGLVGITAGADQMSPTDAIVIGAVAGALIVFAVSLIDRLKLDDPVGAIAVHLVCGIWGTLAVGLFGNLASGAQFVSQLIGVASYAAICLVSSFLILYIIKKIVGIRVSEREELEGLDAHEHGMDAYPDFRLNEH